MQILVTGSQGFIGQNLVTELLQLQSYTVDSFNRDDAESSLEPKIIKADAIIHLAGENRPSDDGEFERSNHQLTRKICQVIERVNKNIPIIFSSSTQATEDNPYGKSKLMVENILKDISLAYDLKVTCLRYFNAAGAHIDGDIGEAHDPETHLIPNILILLMVDLRKFVYS